MAETDEQFRSLLVLWAAKKLQVRHAGSGRAAMHLGHQWARLPKPLESDVVEPTKDGMDRLSQFAERVFRRILRGEAEEAAPRCSSQGTG
jgi:hypothetical protein